MLHGYANKWRKRINNFMIIDSNNNAEVVIVFVDAFDGDADESAENNVIEATYVHGTDDDESDWLLVSLLNKLLHIICRIIRTMKVIRIEIEVLIL